MLYNHETYPLSENDLKMVKSVPEGGNWKDIPSNIPSKRLEQIRKSGGRTTLYGRLRSNKPSYTITTYFHRPGNGTNIHPKQHRVISAREAARLQSFPDNYIFHGSKTSLCKQIGNAVPPLLAYFIAKRIRSYTKTKYVLDLFCGAGGLSKGFEWAGFKIIASNDNDSAACETYRHNHKNTVLIEGDITKNETKKRLFNSKKNRKIDVIIGGPPCQGYSHAGKRMIDDQRNFLYKEFVVIVKKIKPKVILMENVEGILTINKGKTPKSIIEDFSKIGYKLIGKKIHAVRYGVPQKRKRVIFIGVKKGNPEDCFPKEIIHNEDKHITVNMAIDNLPPIRVNGGKRTINQKLKSRNFFQRFLAGELSMHQFVEILTRTS